MVPKLTSIIRNLFIVFIGYYLIQLAPTSKYPIIIYILGGLNLLIGFSALIIPFTIHLLKKTTHENKHHQ